MPMTTDPHGSTAADAASETSETPRAGRTSRFWWLLAGSVMAVGFLVWGFVQVGAVVSGRRDTATREFEAAGVSRLVVDDETGDVRISRTDGDRVILRVTYRGGLTDAVRDERVVDRELRVTASCPSLAGPFCTVDYDIELPDGIPPTVAGESGDIAVEGLTDDLSVVVDSGSIAVREFRGSATLRTDSGDIDASGLDCRRFTATSDNGDVRAEFVTAAQRVTATSDNGDVDVAVPSGSSFALDAHSDNGDVTTKIRTDPTSRRRITATSDDGDVTVRSR